MDRPVSSIRKLVDIVAKLRGPEGCPWDKVQTTGSLKPYLLEECHEFLDAVDGTDTAEIRDELGDLLLQIVLHARIYEERGLFTLNDAAEAICAKMIRRHPHVFARQPEHESTDLDMQWETIKTNEKNASGKRPGVFEHLQSELPILQTALKVSKKAALIGLDWPDAKGVLMKIREEIEELEEAMEQNDIEAIRHELGDLMFASVSLARHLNVDAELSLKENLMRFIRRVGDIESSLQDQGKTFSDSCSEELDQLWEAAKQNEKCDKIT